jgi:TonB family protein
MSQPMRSSHVISSALVVCLAVDASLAAQTADRVDTKAALAQVITRVEPQVPAAAAAAKTGGVVIADVTIGVNGRVSSVSILGGPAPLHAAAQIALRQWTFKPFVRNGKPRTVITILEVNFPDPVRDEENRNREALRAAQYECDRELEKNQAAAVTACKVAYDIATKMSFGPIVPNNYGMEEMTGRTYLTSLVQAKRLPEALDVANEMLARRSPPRVGDRLVAEYQMTVALLQQRTGANDDAAASFARAEGLYEAVAAQSPQARQTVAPTLKQALQLHAAFLRSRGDSERAAALESRAAAIAVVEPTSSAASRPVVTRTMRRVGDVVVRETTEARITDDDLRVIQVVLAPKRLRWVFASQVFGAEPQPVPSAIVCVEADVVTPELRRGACAILVRRSGNGNPKGGWQRMTSQDHAFVQLASDGADAAPIQIRSGGSGPLPGDAALVGMLMFVRSKAVAAETALRRSDVQPWPFEEVLVLNGESRVTLTKADGSAMQHVTLRPQGNGWEIVQMR